MSYNVYRDGTLIGSVAGNSDVVTGLTNGVQYSFQVSSVVNGVEGPLSVAVLATPQAVLPPPPPPAGPDPAWATALRAAFAGITYGNTYTLPDSIEHTGATGVSAAINAFIAGKPDGASPTNHTRIIFPPGYTYLLNGVNAINLSGRSNITLEGTGCLLNNRCTPSSLFTYDWYLLNCHNIVIRGFSVDGGNAATATSAVVGIEALSAAAVAAGCTFIEFDHVSWDRTYGFGPLICSNEGTVWPSDVWLHDCTIRGGEMGVGVTAGRRLLVERCLIKDSQYTAIDLEPDSSQAQGGGFEDVLVQDNIIDTYGWHEISSNWFVATVPQAAVVGTCTMNRLTVRRNSIIRGPANPLNNGNYDGQGGLSVRADSTNPKTAYVFTDNLSSHPSTMPAGGGRALMKFASLDGLTVTGNTQKVNASPLVALGAGVTNSVTTPNVTT